MTLVRSKPSGYGLHDIFTHVEAEIIDAEIVRALDAINGGSYDLTAANLTVMTTHSKTWTFGTGLDVTFSGGNIVFTNNDILVNGPVMAFQNNQLLIESTSDLQVQSSAEFTGTTVDFTCAGPVTFDGPVVVLKNNALSIDATSGVTCDAPTAWNGNNVFDSGTTDFGNGASTLINFNSDSITEFKTGSTLTLDIAVTLAGDGRVPGKFVTGPDSAHTFYAGDANFVRIPDITASRIYTLSSTGAVAGDWICFYFTGSGLGSFTLTVKDDGGFTLGVALNSGGTPKACMFLVYSGTLWQVVTAIAHPGF